jgi:hypothetical protein
VVVLIQIIKGMEGKKMVFTMIYLLLSVVRFVINSMTVATQRTIERKGHVLDFHKYLHYGSKGSWPIDGNDSGFIEIGGL